MQYNLRVTKKRNYNTMQTELTNILTIDILSDNLKPYINNLIDIAFKNDSQNHIINNIQSVNNAKKRRINFWQQISKQDIQDYLIKIPQSLRLKAQQYIKYYQENQPKENRFMPCKLQCESLKKVLLNLNIKMPSNWYEFIDLWDYNNILYTITDNPLVMIDQQIRANKIIDKMQLQPTTNKQIKITLMDGHGRMVLELLKVLQKKKYNLNNVYIRIIDIDPYVNQWHELCFPTKFTEVVHSDIYNEQNIYDLFYMNFCGLQNSNNKLIQFLKTQQENNNLSKVIVSFSIRGKNNNNNNKTLTTLLKEYNGDIISERNLFKTIAFK